ncbi:hypothetical protein M422DRAFT_277359 [Sphaerobolus stellatus SS14]|uniref:Uncharacterized protein n=1 Tax=Sphaerobolus stellatus (strain SS14) TaxID=990650 RepID=A0A0C9U9P6_SPHS4|nr:hypothetical protein M422DRAFT_277359 [Sphaerobolus stellatus SS14]
MSTHCIIPVPDLSELSTSVASTPETMMVDVTSSPAQSRSSSPITEEAEASQASSGVQASGSPVMPSATPITQDANHSGPNSSSPPTQNDNASSSSIPIPQAAYAPPSPYVPLSTSPPLPSSASDPGPSTPSSLQINHVSTRPSLPNAEPSAEARSRSRASSWMPPESAAEREREREQEFEEHALPLFQQMGDLLQQAFVVQARRGNMSARLPRPVRVVPTFAMQNIARGLNTTGSVRQVDPDPINIAGICVDPTNGWVYVASSTGIVEWRVREREEGKGGSVGAWR